MKMGLLLVPFLLVANRACSVSASSIRRLDEGIITDTVGFVDAIRNATETPSDILVDVNTKIDFDDGTTTVSAEGLDLERRYFNALCIGYDETNKCTLERSSNGGRFFYDEGPYLNVSFTGFEFKGGSAPDGGSASVFDLKRGIHPWAPFVATFTDCVFADGTARALRARVFDDESYLSFIRCEFSSSKGAISVHADLNSELNLFIADTTFSNTNSVPGGDIMGSKGGNGIINLNCTGTATSFGSRSVALPGQQTCSGGWDEITYDNFEGGWGNFTKKNGAGKDARRVDDDDDNESDYIPKGSGALRIRENGKKSSVFHKSDHDVGIFSKLVVSFWFRSRDMEDGDAFLLQYSSDGGTNWDVMKKFVHGEDKDFENGDVYKEIVGFDESGEEYELTSEARIRFKCDANKKNDKVYIDEVLFEGL